MLISLIFKPNRASYVYAVRDESKPSACCRLAHTGACNVVFGDLLLSGLSHRDLQTRNRAVHLLTEAIQAGAAPKVTSILIIIIIQSIN